jgi:hypothetical protein
MPTGRVGGARGAREADVDEDRIQREAEIVLQFGLLGTEYATAVAQGTLAASMVGPVP